MLARQVGVLQQLVQSRVKPPVSFRDAPSTLAEGLSGAALTSSAAPPPPLAAAALSRAQAPSPISHASSAASGSSLPSGGEAAEAQHGEPAVQTARVITAASSGASGSLRAEVQSVLGGAAPALSGSGPAKDIAEL